MLIERGEQLCQLVGRLEALGHSPAPALGHRPVVALTGPVGSGKTALLQAFAARATETGARFLAASASRAERAVPFEVFRQLVRMAPLGVEARHRVSRLLDEAILVHGDLHGVDHGRLARLTAALGSVLLDLATGTPLVIAVDDVHHADLPSLQCLDYLARRSAATSLMIVLAESPRTAPWHPELYEGLLQPARLHRIRVPLLSPDGTFALLVARLGMPAARSVGDECHRISGGSPLLVHALADDHLAGTAGRGDQPVTGEAFREAVLSCLYRCEHLLLKAARALAVSGQSLCGSLPARLVEGHTGTALESIDVNNSAGLVVDGRLRHPAVEQAVLDATTAEERARLHGQAASLLHHDGAPAVEVARHLVQTGEPAEPWMTQALVEAGEQALSEGDVHTSLRYLRRANRDCADDDCQRARVRSALVRAEWQLDPQAAVPHLQGLADAVQAGHLGTPRAALPIHYLLWHGLVDKAVELVQHLRDRTDTGDPQSVADLFVASGWLTMLYPGALDNDPAPPVPARDPLTLSRIKQRLLGANLLGAVLERGDVGAVDDAERALRTAGPDSDTAYWTAVCALIAMIYADRLDLAGSWCTRLRNASRTHLYPAPAALLDALEAVIAVRRGDLPAAQALTDSALTQLPAKSWGIAIGIPLAARLRALAMVGDLDRAAACLRVPVPAALFETPFGLHYLHARGVYALAADNPDAALADFQLCGRLMTQWRLDLPALVPWRTDAARALLRQGNCQQAEALVREELSRLQPGHVRHRGAALRVLAAMHDPPARLQHLRTSVRLLQQTGDRIELVHSLTDLGHAYQVLGDHRQARSASRAARMLAEECGITLVAPGPAPAGGGAPEPRGVEALVEGLSDAESKVATLAAQGHTNREIAAKLFLTVSTIEQRLTRIYRKLHVNSRSELAARLRSTQPGAMTAGRGTAAGSGNNRRPAGPYSQPSTPRGPQSR
ncbi:AAA family ATPase [Micromonospora sp. NPDC047074]|uniref:helix-turn-helix transcriptional regulator n=1 Tax=Micromonospora sp. NPDC047074 TaxID=3154339 RepID=UPI0033E21BAD